MFLMQVFIDRAVLIGDADHVTADLSPTSYSPPRLCDTPEVLLHGHTWRSSLTTSAEVSRPRRSEISSLNM